MSTDSQAELIRVVQEEQPHINAVLLDLIHELPPLSRPIAEHVLLAGGKRLRPLLCLLMGRALGCRSDKLYTLGVAVEMLHAATLLHDDVLDNAEERRKKPSAHTVFPPRDVILAGDALLAKSLSVISRMGCPAMTTCISEAVMYTAEGELAEFAHQCNTCFCYEQYLEIITGKTAWMLRAPCELAALLAEAGPEQLDAARSFGLALGIAFQMVDDVLDFAPSDQTGKPTGGDLREGKLTPPLFFYLESLPDEEKHILQNKIRTGLLANEEIDAVCQAVVRGGFTEKTKVLAEQYLTEAGRALAALPASAEKFLLEKMVVYIRTRSH